MEYRRALCQAVFDRPCRTNEKTIWLPELRYTILTDNRGPHLNFEGSAVNFPRMKMNPARDFNPRLTAVFSQRTKLTPRAGYQRPSTIAAPIPWSRLSENTSMPAPT
jgi:hypothetical protein